MYSAILFFVYTTKKYFINKETTSTYSYKKISIKKIFSNLLIKYIQYSILTYNIIGISFHRFDHASLIDTYNKMFANKT